MTWLRKAWLWFLARFGLSDRAVCELSKGCGWHDYHTLEDAPASAPFAPYHPAECVRCRKKFLW